MSQIREMIQYGGWCETYTVWKHGSNYGIGGRQEKYRNMAATAKIVPVRGLVVDVYSMEHVRNYGKCFRTGIGF